jgi:drug/metabolite transporter (DMT)-like permease
MLLLGAIWGGAFPLLRIASPAFGPVSLSGARVLIAALVLLAVLRDRGLFRRSPVRLLTLGALNTGIPFALFAYATLSITGGLAALLNATTPMFGALFAYVLLGERLTPLRVVGIAVAFAGVAWLVRDAVGFDAAATRGAFVALAGAAMYGFGACLARRWFAGEHPLALAAGSATGGALILAPFAIALWPQVTPPPGAWLALAVLALVCTAFAFGLWFRVLRNVGAQRGVTVSFLFPVFGILWGALFLAEPVGAVLLGGCAVVLAGTALAVGLGDRLLRRP